LLIFPTTAKKKKERLTLGHTREAEIIGQCPSNCKAYLRNGGKIAWNRCNGIDSRRSLKQVKNWSQKHCHNLSQRHNHSIHQRLTVLPFPENLLNQSFGHAEKGAFNRRQNSSMTA